MMTKTVKFNSHIQIDDLESKFDQLTNVITRKMDEDQSHN